METGKEIPGIFCTRAHTHTHTHTHTDPSQEKVRKWPSASKGKRRQNKPTHAGSLILAFQPPELWEIYFNCLWQSVSGILIWQPWQTLNPLLDVKLLKSFYLSNYLSLSSSPFLFRRAALLLPFILLFVGKILFYWKLAMTLNIVSLSYICCQGNLCITVSKKLYIQERI